MNKPTPISVATWALKILLASAFAAAALAKLSSQEMMVKEFDTIGLGQGFRYLVAMIELAGAVLTLVPRTALFGSLTFLVVCVGAFVAQVTRLHGDVVHVFALGVLTALLAWLTRPARTP